MRRRESVSSLRVFVRSPDDIPLGGSFATEPAAQLLCEETPGLRASVAFAVWRILDKLYYVEWFSCLAWFASMYSLACIRAPAGSVSSLAVEHRYFRSLCEVRDRPCYTPYFQYSTDGYVVRTKNYKSFVFNSFRADDY